MAASESIVSNIIIKKTKKIFSFSQKQVYMLDENLKVKAKFKNMKSQKCYEKLSEKKYVYIYFLF